MPPRCAAARGYLEVTGEMVLAMSDLFESIAEDPAAWADDVRTFLPEWLKDGAVARQLDAGPLSANS